MALNSIFERPEKIKLPASLKTDMEGFEFFASLLQRTRKKQKFILDFNEVTWIEANLCAVLGAITQTNKKLGARFEFTNLNDEYLSRTLKNNGFLKVVKGVEPSTHKHSGIPFKSFDMKEEDEVEQYIYEYVLLSEKVPKMTDRAKRKIYRSIFEIYQNSVMHSGADVVFVCGQFYTRKKRMALTMVEVGRSFKENVTNHDPSYAGYSGCQCIEWAVQSGNTTKPLSETGGLGIDLIREFLNMNEGKLQIRSADGYWEEKKGNVSSQSCKTPFNGSIVNIEFNLFDTKEYYTTEEIDVKSIL